MARSHPFLKTIVLASPRGLPPGVVSAGEETEHNKYIVSVNRH
ncbi:MAG TPA: hypothetical protein VKJ00_12625 [Thermoanaerobaculia bacterium]|nr:hypothetical protein [Thermoanaerobaculia bacterium]